MAATPSTFREELGELLAGRQRWARGLTLLYNSGEEVDPLIVEAVCERLGISSEQVMVHGRGTLAWQQVGFATVLVYLAGHGIAPQVTRVIQADNGVILRGGPDRWGQESLSQARQALLAQRCWPRIAVPVVPALKDLGVAIGGGASGKALHQRRLHELFRRTQLISQLGVAFPKRERLVAGSALPAGLYGCASQPPDAYTLDVARRHVLHALHRGSRFCQVSLFFVVAVGAWRADPAAVWLCRAVEAARLLILARGRLVFECVAMRKGEGPIGGLLLKPFSGRICAFRASG